ncbi:MAG: cell wall-active antibiotics response protein [Tannerellaceae bacterium]|jgi:hypothetical protein|nr:cell wall-active antibiotics response protein [Tannerellaceae bacterium]
METTETKKRVNLHQHYKLDKFVAAFMLVVGGFVILGHNLGAVSDYLYRIIISWQMLLIILGIGSFIKRNFLLGCIFLGVGFYFLLPRIIGVERDWLINYWPVFLIVIGLIILFRQRKAPWCGWHHHHDHYARKGMRRTEQSIDGFVTVDVNFGNSRHIVLDPVFRGADLDASFGYITLDLRRTSLEAPETYVEIDCSFGGIEIFVPFHWCLFSEMDNTFGSIEDKRVSQEIGTEHKLIIRGDISFGALEIKN